MSPGERMAVISAFVALKMLHDNSLTPKAKNVAARGAGYCLYALGIEAYGDISACAPEGKTIELLADMRRLG
jgi:hypothetical protein